MDPRPDSPSPLEDARLEQEGVIEDESAPKRDTRHRRVQKHWPGQKLGLALMDHPTREGVVVVSQLTAEGACAQNGVRVGDLIYKVNGKKLANHTQAIKMIESHWAHEALTDRLKLSLHDRTRDVHMIARQPQPLGLKLVDAHTSRFGVVVLAVMPDSPAAAAGLQVGHIIYSANGKLAQHPQQVSKELEMQRAMTGVASVLVSEHKLTETSLRRQEEPFGELPIAIFQSQ